MINYYFAYGSNMNPERMKAREVTFFERLPATLYAYELKLNKEMLDGTAAANINPNPDSEVHGALYICTKDVFDKLDVFEMVADGHYSKECVPVNVRGKIYGAVTYIDHNKINDELKINKEYLEHILRGEDLLPPEYFEFLESFRSRCKE